MRYSSGQRLLWTSLGLAMALTFAGCAVLYDGYVAMRGGPQVPAKYRGLDRKRVAVVCVMKPSAEGTSPTAHQLAQGVSITLRRQIPDIEVVPLGEVADWIDNSDDVDFVAIGRGVKADKVVAIEVESFRMHEGTTLYKGLASYVVSVLDISQGGVKVYETVEDEFMYPVHHPVPAADTTERAFRRELLTVLAVQIAKNFYAYELKEDFATDALAL